MVVGHLVMSHFKMCMRQLLAHTHSQLEVFRPCCLSTKANWTKSGGQKIKSPSHNFRTVRPLMLLRIMKLTHTQHMESLEEKWWNQNPHRAICEAWEDDGKYGLWNIGGIFVMLGIGEKMRFEDIFISFSNLSAVTGTTLWMYVEFVFYKVNEVYSTCTVCTVCCTRCGRCTTGAG